ncbi:helix-turn-helix domain-containing protein [Gordonia sp. OPL2]|uniref:helix-turn-helix domain-containing protein n=1 Tax=Gordonia sp. OPL2 TaxID=2486274 RepID=UPI001654C7A1|nr:AraC family transcriptional regulator [Gordonia sp. OPL2]RPA19817.1 AraC family transcriptional regulator [Gordonia sp. OPL2]
MSGNHDHHRDDHAPPGPTLMTLILDTATLDPGGRTTELQQAFRAAGATAGVAITPLVSGDRFHAQISGWPLGEGATLMTIDSDPIAVALSRSHLGADPVGRVALACVSPGSWTLRQGGVVTESSGDRAAALLLVDQSHPFDFRRTDRGSATIMHVDVAHLDVPRPAVLTAATGLRPSHPLYGLCLSFMDEMGVIARTQPGILSELGTTAQLLARALIVDVAEDCAARRGAPDGPPILARIRHYIAANLDDPDLSADMIARAHSISVRTLYKFWSTTGVALGDHIVGERLERASATLVAQPDLPVASVARRHGFTDPSHFSHRFRDRFAVSPREWRALNA